MADINNLSLLPLQAANGYLKWALCNNMKNMAGVLTWYLDYSQLGRYQEMNGWWWTEQLR